MSVKKNESKAWLTIDLRRDVDFTQRHLPSRLKGMIWAFYLIAGLLLTTFSYQVFTLVRVKKETQQIREEDRTLLQKIQSVKALEASLQAQIKKANTLIHWQRENVSAQQMLNTLLAALPKEVLLERFSFKRSKSDPQATLALHLQGSTWVAHQEFEKVPAKLEAIGLKVISLDQSEIKQGIRLQCLCQFDILGEEVV